MASTQSKKRSFRLLKEWLASLQNQPVPSTFTSHPKLNAEIHSAIGEDSSEFLSTICDHLFTLYRHVQHRPFVLQFLPSFVTAYYDLLYDHHHHHHPESVDATTKDVYSTIDTFLVSLYNLDVIDKTRGGKAQEIRIPNLNHSSIYHVPNPDFYTPTPFTQQVISKHENKPELIRLHTFTPIDTNNTPAREPMLWLLLIQYGKHVSLMDESSRHAFIGMSNKLLGQGFSFEAEPTTAKPQSTLPPSGRRIQVSSQIMAEILGILIYLKTTSTHQEASESMRLLKKRAEYELYADVMLMTESLGYLHEFETQRPDKQNHLGIETEVPSTIEIVGQKRTAMTTRSMKNRHRPAQQHETVNNENSTTDHPSENSDASSIQRPILNVVHDNSPVIEKKKSSRRKTSDQRSEAPTSPMIEEPRTQISTSIGPARSSPSPSTAHRYQTSYFASMQQERTRSASSGVAEATRPHRREISPDVQFVGRAGEQKKSEVEETHF